MNFQKGWKSDVFSIVSENKKIFRLLCMSSYYYITHTFEIAFSKVSEKSRSFKIDKEIKICMMPNYHLVSFMNGVNTLKPISKDPRKCDNIPILFWRIK